jgi:hypothetical protein
VSCALSAGVRLEGFSGGLFGSELSWFISQIFIVPSEEPDANNLPSPLNETEFTESVCFHGTFTLHPESHKPIVPSPNPATKNLPSGLKAMEFGL